MSFVPKNYKRNRVRSDFTGRKKITKQSFAKQADINYIVRKYNKTGELTTGFSSERMAKFGDFATGEDLLSSMIKISKAQTAFLELPPKLRARFNNSPAQMIDFLGKAENTVEAIELGLADMPEGMGIKDGKLVPLVVDPPAPTT